MHSPIISVFEMVLKGFVQPPHKAFISKMRYCLGHMEEKGSGRGMSREELAYLERVYQNQYMMLGNAINSALEELQELSSASKSLEEMDRIAGKESFSEHRSGLLPEIADKA